MSMRVAAFRHRVPLSGNGLTRHCRVVAGLPASRHALVAHARTIRSDLLAPAIVAPGWFPWPLGLFLRKKWPPAYFSHTWYIH